MENERIVFGPVPSRRFGRSLGINNIPPPKKCSYSCIYCQIGKTVFYENERKEFFRPEEVEKEVREFLESLKNKKIDCITFVPDGEPTIDINLGKEIEALKKFRKKIIVLTNSSLIYRKDVREDLKKADCVSLKIDAVSEEIWQKINRPYRGFELNNILTGIEIFSKEYKGKLLTETIFVKNINDSDREIEMIGNFIRKIKPSLAYIGFPSRPPCENWVEIPEKEKIDYAYIVFKKKGIEVKIIGEKKQKKFGFTGNLIEDILGIISVHPMSKKEIEEFIRENGGDLNLLRKLKEEGKVVEVEYQNEKYYRRVFK